jgi:hypothetical protein
MTSMQRKNESLAKQFERHSEEKKLEQLRVRLAEKMQASDRDLQS